MTEADKAREVANYRGIVGEAFPAFIEGWEAALSTREGEWQFSYAEKWVEGDETYDRVTFDSLPEAQRYKRNHEDEIRNWNAGSTPNLQRVAVIEKRQTFVAGGWVQVEPPGGAT